MSRDFVPLGTVRSLGLPGPWTLSMSAPMVFGVSELEPIGVRVGEALVVRALREPYFALIVRAARQCGTNVPFMLVYEAAE